MPPSSPAQDIQDPHRPPPHLNETCAQVAPHKKIAPIAMSNKSLRTTPPRVPRRKPLGLSTFIGLLLVTTMVPSTTTHILDVEPLFKFDVDHRNTPTLRHRASQYHRSSPRRAAPLQARPQVLHCATTTHRHRAAPDRARPKSLSTHELKPERYRIEGDFHATHRLINGKILRMTNGGNSTSLGIHSSSYSSNLFSLPWGRRPQRVQVIDETPSSTCLGE